MVSSLICYQNSDIFSFHCGNAPQLYSLWKEHGNLNKWSLFKCITLGTACICRLVLPAMAVSSYVPVQLSILMCVGCHKYSTYSNMMGTAVTAALVPLIYITLVILKMLLWKRNSYLHKLVTHCLRKRCNENVEDPLPYRLVHPNAYYRSCSLSVDNHILRKALSLILLAITFMLNSCLTIRF